jgi:solute carrier family 35 (UDP-galactose transporter), member B1
MQLPGNVKRRGSAARLQHLWTRPQEQIINSTMATCDRGGCDDLNYSARQSNTVDAVQNVDQAPPFCIDDEVDTSTDDPMETHSDMMQPMIPLLHVPVLRHQVASVANTSPTSNTAMDAMPTMESDLSHHESHYVMDRYVASSISNGTNANYLVPPTISTTTDEASCISTSTTTCASVLPLHRRLSPTPYKDDEAFSRTHTPTTAATTSTNSRMAQTKAMQLLVGTAGIYSAYLYYGVVQEDLFRYRSISGVGFSYVWSLQVLESAVTMIIGYIGRKLDGGRKNLPILPFFHSGVSQLAAKALMSLSLAAGLSFPVVVLAKSAKIVPVMIGQLLLGGSKYNFHDYLFAVMIVAGTSLLSSGNTSEDAASGSDTFTGLVLITLSLTADGFTGGLQKKLKRVTASMAPTTYDFLFYSHVAQFFAAIVACFITGEIQTAASYLMNNPTIWWWIVASCVCSAIGQCFVFYVISCFDPVVCTTITTTRKMLTVMFSIGFKGHNLSNWGYIGLGIAVSALLLEVEAKYAQYRGRQKGKVEEKQSCTTTSSTGNLHETSLPSVTL